MVGGGEKGGRAVRGALLALQLRAKDELLLLQGAVDGCWDFWGVVGMEGRHL